MVCSSVSINFDSPQSGKQLKLKNIDPEICSFCFSEKGLGIISLPNFVYDFLVKMFLMLYFINWPNLIASLLLLLEILVNKCIAIVC